MGLSIIRRYTWDAFKYIAWGAVLAERKRLEDVKKKKKKEEKEENTYLSMP